MEFTAVEEGTSAKDEQVQTVGVSSESEYLLFSRNKEELDDWGVYLEYSDQINGGYECIQKCVISEEAIDLKLSKQLGQLKGVDGFFIRLELNESEYDDLLQGLKYIFRGKSGFVEAHA